MHFHEAWHGTSLLTSFHRNIYSSIEYKQLIWHIVMGFYIFPDVAELVRLKIIVTTASF